MDKKDLVKIPPIHQLKKPNPGVILESVRELETFAFSTAKKKEKPHEEIQKKTVYKIQLSTLAPKNEIKIDMQSLYDKEGPSFFQLNPIVKVQLKERLYSKHQSTSHHIEKPDLDNRISSLVSYWK